MSELSKVVAHADPNEVVRLQGRLDGILATVEALGFHVGRPRRRAPYVEQQRPASTPLIADLLSMGGERDLGEVFFRHVSSIHHASIAGLSAPLAEPGNAGSKLLRPDTITYTVTAAALAYMEAFGRALERYGWDPEMWERWVQHALRDLQQAVQATSAASR